MCHLAEHSMLGLVPIADHSMLYVTVLVANEFECILATLLDRWN